MSSRRRFLGAAAAALGVVPFTTSEKRSLESGDGFVDAERWDHAFVDDFKGVQYSAGDSRNHAWADAPFVTIDANPDDTSELLVEFREEDRRRPGTVSAVTFTTEFEVPEHDLDLYTHSDVDVATARELAHIILEETEPVEADE